MAIFGFSIFVLIAIVATICAGFTIMFGGFELGCLFTTRKLSDKIIALMLITGVGSLWYAVFANVPFEITIK